MDEQEGALEPSRETLIDYIDGLKDGLEGVFTSPGECFVEEDWKTGWRVGNIFRPILSTHRALSTLGTSGRSLFIRGFISRLLGWSLDMVTSSMSQGWALANNAIRLNPGHVPPIDPDPIWPEAMGDVQDSFGPDGLDKPPAEVQAYLKLDAQVVSSGLFAGLAGGGVVKYDTTRPHLSLDLGTAIGKSIIRHLGIEPRYQALKKNQKHGCWEEASAPFHAYCGGVLARAQGFRRTEWEEGHAGPARWSRSHLEPSGDTFQMCLAWWKTGWALVDGWMSQGQTPHVPGIKTIDRHGYPSSGPAIDAPEIPWTAQRLHLDQSGDTQAEPNPPDAQESEPAQPPVLKLLVDPSKATQVQDPIKQAEKTQPGNGPDAQPQATSLNPQVSHMAQVTSCDSKDVSRLGKLLAGGWSLVNVTQCLVTMPGAMGQPTIIQATTYHLSRVGPARMFVDIAREHDVPLVEVLVVPATGGLW